MDKNNIQIRERAVNFIQIVENTKDSYPNGIGHGIQKDSIQNGWDARLKKDKNFVENNWKVEFELIENEKSDKTILTITDYGTSGLIGNMTSDKIKEDIDLPQEEKWARWESLAWNKEDPSGLGARGQGKMIIIGGSKDYEIYYDSLRIDNTYRAGWTKAEKHGCPLAHKDDDEAKKWIKTELGLDPINHIGTRIIIINPQDELVAEIKSDRFLDYIEETWWPIILKYKAKIVVKYGNVEKTANVPSLFPINIDDNQTETHKIWIKENVKVKFNKKDYIIKKIAIGYDRIPPVNENNVGVGVFRFGMKVTSINFPIKAFRDYVFGYVEFNEDLDKKLYNIELPSHYDFKNEGIWKKIKDKIEEEMEAFGHKKLGLGIDREKNEKSKRTNAENKAIHVLRAVTKDWPFPKTGKGPGGGTDTVHPPTHKEIGLQLHNLKFPNAENSPQLNYNDEISGFQGIIFNKCKENLDIKMRYTVHLISGDRLIKELDKKDFTLGGRKEILSENYKFKADKTLFASPGEYGILLKLVDLDNNKPIDKIKRRFWVEAEPELKGLFEMQRASFSELSDFQDINKDMEWFLEPKGDNQYVFYYNIEHPSYLEIEEEEIKRSQYISEIALQGALELLIKNIKNEELNENDCDKLPFDINKLTHNDPLITYRESVKAISILKAQARKLT